jgi:hypothetical protein
MMAGETETPLPAVHVEQVSETEKLERRRYQDARTAAIRRGTWIVGTWCCFLGTIGATFLTDGWEKGAIAAVLIFAGAGFTGVVGLSYAAQRGFEKSLTSRSKADRMSWWTVLWVTLWSTLVGGGVGLTISLFIARESIVIVLLSAVAAFVVGAALGNRWAHRRYPRHSVR